MITISRILYPTDFSDLSVRALEYAQWLALRLEAELHCLHVVDDSYQYWIATDVSAMPVGPPIEEVLQESSHRLEQFLSDHLGKSFACHKATRRGQAAQEIVQYAITEQIDLVVMGTHGRTALGQVLVGSVAKKVVRKSPCPVMTVRASQLPQEAGGEPGPV